MKVEMKVCRKAGSWVGWMAGRLVDVRVVKSVVKMDHK
jgi:hypothetical protein